MDKKRYFQIDFAKAIGIFLVVLSHVIFFNKDLGKGLKLFNSFINAFHMPLFFIISGLNLGLSKSTKEKNQYKSLCKKILLPYLVWSILYIVLFSFYLPYDYFGVDTVGEKIYSAVSFYGMIPLWFLSALFLGQIVYRFVISFKVFDSHSKISHLTFLLICFGVSVLVDREFHPFPSNLDILYAYPIIAVCRVLPVLFFIEIGYFASLIWEKYINLSFRFRFLIFLINIGIIYFLKDLFMYNNFLSYFIIQDMKSFLATGILGSFMIITFCSLFNKEIGMITEIGKRTMDIMTLHLEPIPIAYILSYIFTYLGLKNYVFIYSILLLTICYWVSKTLCDKIRQHFAYSFNKA